MNEPKHRFLSMSGEGATAPSIAVVPHWTTGIEEVTGASCHAAR
jgi:hypothetical protein